MARTRYIYYCWSCNKVYIECVCVSHCIIAPVIISGNTIGWHFSSSQFKYSSHVHSTKKDRAAEAWQWCKEKLLKVNCSAEEAVYRALQGLSHQPPPSHSKVPRAPHWEVSAQSHFTEQMPCSLSFQLLRLPHGLETGRQFSPLTSYPQQPGSEVLDSWHWGSSSWRKAAAPLLQH